jgi:ribose 1,5-bisphosphate isomerase
VVADRPHLSPPGADKLDEFESPSVLGASRQLEIAADLLVCVAKEHKGSNADLVHQLRDVTAYLTALRGEASQAIPNALALMLEGIEDRQDLPSDEFRASIIEQCGNYAEQARRQMKAITEYGASLATGAKRILAFDYSSSVAAILKAIGRTDSTTTVVIPEARTLDGGRRYVEDLEQSLLTCEFIPDAAIGSKVKGCNLAFIGAETVSAEGGCYNTTGSLMVALACQYWRVPLYTPTTLVKIDTRTLFGRHRPIPDLSAAHLRRLTEGWPDSLATRVHLSSPDLDYVPPALMTGFVTEEGIIPPAAISTHAARLAGSAGGG